MVVKALRTKGLVLMAKWRLSRGVSDNQGSISTVGAKSTLTSKSYHPKIHSAKTSFSLEEIDMQKVHLDSNFLPKPSGLTNFFSSVKELALSGGGGAGRAYPAAFVEATRFGLDFNNIEVVCATSVGSIMGLGIVIGAPVSDFKKILDKMPTDKFQDWSLSSILSIFKNWGICEGKVMPSYFRHIIKEYTKLEDPSFEELYAITGKEFRVIVANASRKKMQILSHKTTPKMSVAEAVSISCGVPILFPPRMIPNSDGELEYYVDGGILKNYPWGVGSDASRKIEEQLGFIFVNSTAAYALNNDGNNGVFNFLDYLYNLLTLIIFQDPLCLPDAVQARTIAISLGWNPLNFSPNPDEQKLLDSAGKKSVRKSVKQILQTQHGCKLDGFSPIPVPTTPLYQYRHSQVFPHLGDGAAKNREGQEAAVGRFILRRSTP